MTLELKPEQMAVLQQLSQELDCSKVSAVRAGLSLLAVALREAKQGRRIGIIEGDKPVREICGVWSDRIEAMV